MKKVNMNTKFNVIKEAAKELNIPMNIVMKEDLVNAINNKIDESKPKAGKWYEQEGAFPFTEGSLAIITNHPNKAILGRMVEIVGPSTKRNAVKCYMINPKNGGHQKTCLSLDFEMITEHIPSYPMVVETTSVVTA